jgi:hypothetical protein
VLFFGKCNTLFENTRKRHLFQQILQQTHFIFLEWWPAIHNAADVSLLFIVAGLAHASKIDGRNPVVHKLARQLRLHRDAGGSACNPVSTGMGALPASRHHEHRIVGDHNTLRSLFQRSTTLGAALRAASSAALAASSAARCRLKSATLGVFR